MKYRIIEIKYPGKREFYYPQYKKFLFWRNIGNNYKFINSNFNRDKNSDEFDIDSDKPYVYYKNEAEEIIEKFKKFYTASFTYTKIYNI